MEKISKQEFLLRQPDYPNWNETDEYYYNCGNELYNTCKYNSFVKSMPEGVYKRIVLTLINYLQDIVGDTGLWRSFVNANRELYGFSIPFHTVSESYIDYELNREDVRFLVWYLTAMLWEEKRLIFPHDNALISFADNCFDYLDSVYDNAPIPVNYNLTKGLDLNDAEDTEKILHLGNWLFLHSYLLTPAFALSLHQLMSEMDTNNPDFTSELNKRLEEAIVEDTTGPLALFIPEWVYLIINGALPKPKNVNNNAEHPYYKKFITNNDGKTIKFFNSYSAMNQFFIDALGWEPGEEHLAQVKGANDYVLMVNKSKGMLMASNICRCIKSPDNPYYNKGYADQHAIELLTERGCCPGDLLHEILRNNWLPDAKFPNTDDYKLVADNADFIARVYLQLYYRGD